MSSPFRILSPSLVAEDLQRSALKSETRLALQTLRTLLERPDSVDEGVLRGQIDAALQDPAMADSLLHALVHSESTQDTHALFDVVDTLRQHMLARQDASRQDLATLTHLMRTVLLSSLREPHPALHLGLSQELLALLRASDVNASPQLLQALNRMHLTEYQASAVPPVGGVGVTQGTTSPVALPKPASQKSIGGASTAAFSSGLSPPLLGASSSSSSSLLAAGSSTSASASAFTSVLTIPTPSQVPMSSSAADTSTGAASPPPLPLPAPAAMPAPTSTSTSTQPTSCSAPLPSPSPVPAPESVQAAAATTFSPVVGEHVASPLLATSPSLMASLIPMLPSPSPPHKDDASDDEFAWLYTQHHLLGTTASAATSASTSHAPLSTTASPSVAASTTTVGAASPTHSDHPSTMYPLCVLRLQATERADALSVVADRLGITTSDLERFWATHLPFPIAPFPSSSLSASVASVASSCHPGGVTNGASLVQVPPVAHALTTTFELRVVSRDLPFLPEWTLPLYDAVMDLLNRVTMSHEDRGTATTTTRVDTTSVVAPTTLSEAHVRLGDVMARVDVPTLVRERVPMLLERGVRTRVVERCVLIKPPNAAGFFRAKRLLTRRDNNLYVSVAPRDLYFESEAQIPYLAQAQDGPAPPTSSISTEVASVPLAALTPGDAGASPPVPSDRQPLPVLTSAAVCGDDGRLRATQFLVESHRRPSPLYTTNVFGGHLLCGWYHEHDADGDVLRMYVLAPDHHVVYLVHELVCATV